MCCPPSFAQAAAQNPNFAIVLPQLEEVCFQREDGTVPMVPIITAGRVDLKEVAGLLQGSTERPLAVQVHMGTWNLVSLKNDNRKVTMAHLRSVTGREGTPSDPFIVRFMKGPSHHSGATSPRVDASAERAARLAQPSLAQPPSLNNLEAFLFGQHPSGAKLPLSADLLNQLRLADPVVAARFAAGEDRARQLAGLLSHSVEWQPTARSEAMTAKAVNQILVNVLQGIDRLVGAERGLQLALRRGWASDCGQVRACAGGLPDGQLLGGAGQKLLAVWEERGSDHTLQEAAADLAAKAPVHVPNGVPYLIGFAAAGLQLQFFAVRGGDNAPGAVPLGRAFDLGRAADRAWVVAAAANLYQLFALFGRVQESLNRPADELAHAVSAL
ncbi:hypothetical protein COCOBI_01-0280 [Coccomyxa sp. Obi]|nr:hypothetical protein COCOBI_01-0280 [Coccomyxa sp. Obi]